MIQIEAQHLRIRYFVTPEQYRRQRAAMIGIKAGRGMLGIALSAMSDLDEDDARAVIASAPDDIEGWPVRSICAWAAQVAGTTHGGPAQ